MPEGYAPFENAREETAAPKPLGFLLRREQFAFERSRFFLCGLGSLQGHDLSLDQGLYLGARCRERGSVFDLHGVVHITGGSFEGNIPRVLPKGVRARLDPDSWPRPPIFGFLKQHGEIPETEMRRVFNCGIGLMVVVHRDEAEEITHRLEAMGERAYRIGAIEAKGAHEPPLVFAPGSEGTAAD